jgi:hypothetical protein
MQPQMSGVLIWVGLVIGYAWSVWNLARPARRPRASDAGASGIRIDVGTGRRSGYGPALGAAELKSTSQGQASGSPT